MIHKQNLQHPEVVMGDEYILDEINIKADPVKLSGFIKPAIFLVIAFLIFKQAK